MAVCGGKGQRRAHLIAEDEVALAPAFDAHGRTALFVEEPPPQTPVVEAAQAQWVEPEIFGHHNPFHAFFRALAAFIVAVVDAPAALHIVRQADGEQQTGGLVVVVRFGIAFDLQVAVARAVMSVLDAPGLAQAVAGEVGVAPLAPEAGRVDVRQPAARVVILVGLPQRIALVRDAGQPPGGVVGVAPGLDLITRWIMCVGGGMLRRPRGFAPWDPNGGDRGASGPTAAGGSSPNGVQGRSPCETRARRAGRPTQMAQVYHEVLGPDKIALYLAGKRTKKAG